MRHRKADFTATKHFLSKLQRLLWLGLLAWVGWLGLTLSSPGQGVNLQLESRIDRLESELARVRSRLNQLEIRNHLPSAPLPPPSATADSLRDPSPAEQLDNLATLAIELKQDVRDLQNRVAELETARGDR